VNQTQIFMYGGRYFPNMPDAKINPISRPATQSLEHCPKNQIRFGGINFGFARGEAVDEEIWDDKSPDNKSAKPDHRPASPDGAAPEAPREAMTTWYANDETRRAGGAGSGGNGITRFRWSPWRSD